MKTTTRLSRLVPNVPNVAAALLLQLLVLAPPLLAPLLQLAQTEPLGLTFRRATRLAARRRAEQRVHDRAQELAVGGGRRLRGRRLLGYFAARLAQRAVPGEQGGPLLLLPQLLALLLLLKVALHLRHQLQRLHVGEINFNYR